MEQIGLKFRTQTDRIELKPIGLSPEQICLIKIDLNARGRPPSVTEVVEDVDDGIDKELTETQLEALNLQNATMIRKLIENLAPRPAFNTLVDCGLLNIDQWDEARYGEGNFAMHLASDCLSLMNELEKSDEEREGEARMTLQVLSKSAGSRSLSDTLHFVTSPNYDKNTSQKWVLRMLQYFERTGHEGFNDNTYSAQAVYDMWDDLQKYRTTLLSRYCSGEDACFSILPYHTGMFLNDAVLKNSSAEQVLGTVTAGRKSIDPARLSHGAALAVRTGTRSD